MGDDNMNNGKEVITGSDYRQMINGAYNAFLQEYENINRLNVFPVPDGDTGTNMLQTLKAVTRAVSQAPETSIGSLSKRAADSAIMGARGNSGVILSQIFRGLGRGLAGKEVAGSSELGKAFQYAVLYAYRSVSKPVEGTILTVAKGIAKGAHRAVRSDLPINEILQAAIKAGNEELAKTPELLPSLKAAGVVDAGGRGLIVFLEGCLQGLDGEFTAPETAIDLKLEPVLATTDFEIARPYCTEFIVKNTKVPVKEVRKTLENMGDSMVVAGTDDVLKVHIHTDHPGSVLELAISWGTLHDIKIDNMADQHHEKMSAHLNKDLKKIAIISVSAGDGIGKMMEELGADITIAGGQSMNPAVEQFIDAIHGDIAEKYIILPNNSNIVLSAAQVKKLVGDKVEVIPTVNTPQGMAALMVFNPELDIETNVNNMTENMKNVKSAAITTAVRDSIVDGEVVKEGKHIGVMGNKVLVYGDELGNVLNDTVKTLLNEETEIVSLYYGNNLTADEAQEYADKLRLELSEVEVEIYEGQQPHYYFLISVE